MLLRASTLLAALPVPLEMLLCLSPITLIRENPQRSGVNFRAVRLGSDWPLKFNRNGWDKYINGAENPRYQ